MTLNEIKVLKTRVVREANVMAKTMLNSIIVDGLLVEDVRKDQS